MIESKHSTREYAIKTACKFGDTLRGQNGQTAVIEDHRKRVVVLWCDATGNTHTRVFRWSIEHNKKRCGLTSPYAMTA